MNFEYTKEDFLTVAPYEQIADISDPFLHERQLNALADYASQVGFRGFKKMYAKYVQSLKAQQNTIYANNVTQFEDSPITLDAGDWMADDFGIYRENGTFREEACCHPILPIERLTNIDTGTEKLKLAFLRGKRWRIVVADKKTLASASSITDLANVGIAVTSETAKSLIKYLHDIEALNYDRIPERKSVSRLGYFDEEGFSPYVENLVFDGDAAFGRIIPTIKPYGSFGEWLKLAKQIRATGSIATRIVLAASFASVLIQPLGILPFFVHLWSGASGSGKTVALMLAASVWADPYPGRYIQTFNSTRVGHEMLAAFFNQLPMIIDELQLAKDNKGRAQFDVYGLAEGVGRTRGNKSGGVAATPTWANTIITSGESPLINIGASAGAVNRVIEIEGSEEHKFIEDGHKTASILRENYGYAGKAFVEEMYGENREANLIRAKELYEQYTAAFLHFDTTDKQSMAAACICVADYLANEWIFHDDKILTITEVGEHLCSKEAVSVGERGYKFILDWIAQNANRFRSDSNEKGEVYGEIEVDTSIYPTEQHVYIIRSVFNRACEDGGYSPQTLLSWMKERGLIFTRGRKLTKGRRINGILTECVAMRLPHENEE